MTNTHVAGQTGSPGPAAPTAGFTIEEFLSVILRKWWLVVVAAALGAGVTYWYDKQQVSQYTAHALVQRQGRPATEALGFPGYNPDPLDLASEIQILRSRAILADAVDSAGLRVRFGHPNIRTLVVRDIAVSPQAPAGRYVLRSRGAEFVLTTTTGAAVASAVAGQEINGSGVRLLIAPNAPALREPVDVTVLSREGALKAIQGTLVPDNDAGATLIRLTYRDTDPSYAAAVLNGVAAAYVRHDGRRAREEARRRAQLVERQLGEARDSLNIARKALLEFQAQHGNVDAEQFSTKLEGIEEQHTLARSQLAVLDGIVASLHSKAPIDDAFRRVLVEGAGLLPTGEALYAELRRLQTERQKLTAPRFGFTDSDSRVQATDSLISDTRNELLAIAEQAARLRRRQLDASTQKIAALRAEMAVIPGQNAVGAQLAQRVEAVQRTFDLLADKNYEAHISAEAASGQAQIVDMAVPPTDADPSRPGTLLLGLAAGVFLGVALAFGIENMDSSVRRLGDVERATGLRVLALIPEALTRGFRLGKRRSVGIMEDQRAAESFRLLRTALRFLGEDRTTVMAITSARPKEGKSTVASNLAVAFGKQGLRVLIVDADLRRPTIHNLMRAVRGRGLSEILTGAATLKQVERKTRYDHVWMVTCGGLIDNPAELLGSAPFTAFVAECRLAYDVIIIDTPPILAVADAALVGSAVDGMIVVARAGETNRHALTHAANELRKFEVPMIGVVLNAAPTVRTYGRYGGYSGYYHFEAYNDYYLDAEASGEAPKVRRSSKKVDAVS